LRISLFLIVFISLYSGLHYYLYLKAIGALALDASGKAALGAFFVLMVLTPILVRLAEHNGLDPLARLLGFGGYSWMGFAFLFFSLALIFDLYRLIIWLSSFWFDLSALTISPRTRFFLPGIAALVIAVFGFFSAQNVRLETLTIATEKLPAQVNRLRLAFISDVHLGLMVSQERLARILAVVNQASPDMLISLGDLVDGQLNHVEDSMELLAKQDFPMGKYAVLGNHEYFVGLSNSMALISQAGFTLLRDEITSVAGGLILVGVDDPIGRRLELASPLDEASLLMPLPRDQFILLLKHQPYVNDKSRGLFDLQISGHTHGGQIFPFYLLTRLFFTYARGLSDLGWASSVYVSRGSGTWGPPIRFLAPPEVTVIDLVRQNP